MKFLSIIIIVAGIVGVLCGIVITPEFTANYISADNVITHEGYEAIHKLRLFSFLLGSLFLLIGILLFKIPEHMRRFIGSPIGTMVVLIIGWIVIAFVNFLIKRMGLNTGTPNFFPFSEFYGPRIHLSGLPFTVLFLVTFFISLKYSAHFRIIHVWAVGLALIVLGNLAQGGIEEAFYKPLSAPFYYMDIPYYHQYYHEAIQIDNWREWLGSFNINQSNLLKHTRTHPPFAVLLHYFILKFSNNNLSFLAGSFVLLASLSIILIFYIMNILGLSKLQSCQFALLFSVIPAYNIYSAVSLDGVILSFAAIFLLGVIMIIKNKINLKGVALFVIGLLVMNLLTFSGLFLVATAGLIALSEVLIHRNRNILVALLITVLTMILIYFYMVYYYGYDHVQAFFTALRLEPKSVSPLRYVMTRLENVTMFAIFLSFGIVSVLVRPEFLKLQVFDLHNNINSVFLAGVIPLLIFLLIGGLYTGEIARICLFIYPFFLLLLRKVEEPVLRIVVIAAGVQTIIMQTFGGYFW